MKHIHLDRENHTLKVYLKTLGQRILSESNDLKRTPEALAADLGCDLRTLRSVIAGEASKQDARNILTLM